MFFLFSTPRELLTFIVKLNTPLVVALINHVTFLYSPTAIEPKLLTLESIIHSEGAINSAKTLLLFATKLVTVALIVKLLYWNVSFGENICWIEGVASHPVKSKVIVKFKLTLKL